MRPLCETSRYNGVREECLRFGENRNYGVNGSPGRGLLGRVLKKETGNGRDREGPHLVGRPGEREWPASLAAENKMYQAVHRHDITINL